MSTSRSSSYSHAEDMQLCHVYLDVSQNPIIGIYQSMEMFWARIEAEYNNSKPDYMIENRTGRSLQSRMSTILTAVGKMRSCLRQIETLNPSGASEVDMMNRAKVLFAQDKKYKRGFKFDHVWPILKDMQKFSDNDRATSTLRRSRAHNVSSQEDSPTPESPTTASPGLSSFSLNIGSDDGGGSSSQRPIGVKKAKLKKRATEENSTIVSTFTAGQDKLVEVFEKNNQERQRTNDILERKLELWETKIIMMDLNSITDPRKREFVNQQQLKIMAKHARQQGHGSGSSSGSFNDFFNNIGGSDNGLPDY